MAIGLSIGTSQAFAHDPDGSPPEPTMTYTEKDAREGETVAHGELYLRGRQHLYCIAAN